MLRDLRDAVRSLTRSPGFTAVAVMTLSLGIGATAAIFTLLDAIVLNPLKYPHADRLAWVESSVPGIGPGTAWGVSTAGFFEFEDRLTTTEAIAAYYRIGISLVHNDRAEGINAVTVTAGLLPLLGGRAALGRLIDSVDDRRGAEPVIVLSHSYWASRFGSDPAIVGRSVLVDGNPTVVIGVMAPGIELPRARVDAWLPRTLNRSAPAVNQHWLSAIVRMKPGVELADLQADLHRVTATFPERFPRAYDAAFMRESQFSTRTRALRDEVIGTQGRTLWILLGAVSLVLCIAAANVAALLLVRAEGRRTELRIRAALGASRGRIARHLIAEGVIIALVASALGLALAAGALQGLIALAPASLPRLEEVAVGLPTIGFGALVALMAGIGAGGLPVFHFNAAVPLGGMSGVAVGRIHGQQHSLTRNTLVVAQMALAVMLLAAAGLMLRSFNQLRSVEPGLDPRGLLAVELTLPWVRYRDYSSTVEFYRGLSDRVKRIPGVVSSGVLSDLPVEGFAGCSSVFLEGRPLASGDNPPCVPTPIAGPGTFQALGTAVRGREPQWSDLDGGSGAVVVTAALARRFWPGEDPIGKGIRGNGDDAPYYRVVGVTGELRARGLDQDPTEAVFFPLQPIPGAPLWSPLYTPVFFVRTSSPEAASVSGAVREAVSQSDPLVAISRIETMEQIIASSASMARLSFMMVLVGLAAGMALTLSLVSIYGVMSYVVGQRKAELGLRMVLGATRRQVSALVVRQALLLAGTGLVLGLVGTLFFGRVMRSLLFGVSTADPVTLFGVSLLLLGTALLAAWIPITRAARLDPMIALRTAP